MKITSRQIEEISLYLADRNCDNNENIELTITQLNYGAIKVENLLGIDYIFDKNGEFPEEVEKNV